MDSEQKQLCRATLSDLKYDLMVAQLKKIFGDCVSPCLGSVKEPVFQTEACDSERDTYYAHRGRGHQNRGRGRGNKQVKFRGSRGGSRNAGYGDSKSFIIQNPEDTYGNTPRCIVCDSIYHWVRNCPDAYENQGKGKHVKEINLLQSPSIAEFEVFVGETLSCGVLDSGCTQTVCGEMWLQCYKDSLSDAEQNSITEVPSNTSFRFGNGQSLVSLKKVKIPII